MPLRSRVQEEIVREYMAVWVQVYVASLVALIGQAWEPGRARQQAQDLANDSAKAWLATNLATHQLDLFARPPGLPPEAPSAAQQ